MSDQLFNLKISTTYLSLLLMVMLFSYLLILFMPLTLYIKYPCFFFITVYMGALFKEVLFRQGRFSISSILYSPHRGWFLFLNDQKIAAILLGKSTLTAFVVILHVKFEHQKERQFLIFRDSLSDDQYRKMLFFIKHG